MADSEAILHWFDDNMQTGFFPNKLASELSIRASDSIVPALVWYYNWVDNTGYKASMRPSIAKAAVPRLIPYKESLVDLLISA